MFTEVKREVRHHVFLNEMLNRQQDGAAVFVDPDVCFWSNVESWHFDALFAGRRIPHHRAEPTEVIVHPRAHTSLFWVPDVRKLREGISSLRSREFIVGFEPFRPLTIRFHGRWHHYDTGASLVAAFPDRVHFFSEQELDCYDHLETGSGTVIWKRGQEPLFEGLMRHYGTGPLCSHMDSPLERAQSRASQKNRPECVRLVSALVVIERTTITPRDGVQP